jgi:short-subunit dehydrogenase
MAARTLEHKTVVITGASSGIGRAAALAFARERAQVVVAARREARLHQLVRECELLGGSALAVPTDVTHPHAMEQLVKAAHAWSGRIDVFINNAGVGAVGEFTRVPVATHDQVIRTNLLGYLHGAHAVLPYFLAQSEGVLINIISLGGWVPAPFSVAYSASKFGLRGFSEALRAELSGFPKIHVCDVFPAFIDTPGFEHAANYVGRKLGPVPPVYSPERVAHAMVALAKSPRAAVTVGVSAHVARLAHFVLGNLTGRIMQYFMPRYFARAPEAPVGDGSLFNPTPEAPRSTAEAGSHAR